MNAVHMLNEKLRNLFASDADHCFDAKVKCPTGRASFWVYFPTLQSGKVHIQAG